MNGWSSHLGADRWDDEPGWLYEITWEWEALPGQRYPGDPARRRKAVHTPVEELRTDPSDATQPLPPPSAFLGGASGPRDPGVPRQPAPEGVYRSATRPVGPDPRAPQQRADLGRRMDPRPPGLERRPGTDPRPPGLERRPGTDPRPPGLDRRGGEPRPPGLDRRPPGLGSRSLGADGRPTDTGGRVDRRPSGGHEYGSPRRPAVPEQWAGPSGTRYPGDTQPGQPGPQAPSVTPPVVPAPVVRPPVYWDARPEALREPAEQRLRTGEIRRPLRDGDASVRPPDGTPQRFPVAKPADRPGPGWPESRPGLARRDVPARPESEPDRLVREPSPRDHGTTYGKRASVDAGVPVVEPDEVLPAPRPAAEARTSAAEPGTISGEITAPAPRPAASGSSWFSPSPSSPPRSAARPRVPGLTTGGVPLPPQPETTDEPAAPPAAEATPQEPAPAPQPEAETPEATATPEAAETTAAPAPPARDEAPAAETTGQPPVPASVETAATATETADDADAESSDDTEPAAQPADEPELADSAEPTGEAAPAEQAEHVDRAPAADRAEPTGQAPPAEQLEAADQAEFAARPEPEDPAALDAPDDPAAVSDAMTRAADRLETEERAEPQAGQAQATQATAAETQATETEAAENHAAEAQAVPTRAAGIPAARIAATGPDSPEAADEVPATATPEAGADQPTASDHDEPAPPAAEPAAPLTVEAPEHRTAPAPGQDETGEAGPSRSTEDSPRPATSVTSSAPEWFTSVVDLVKGATAPQPPPPPARPVGDVARRRRDQGAPREQRLADPEQVLAAYRWEFSPETLRELVDDPDRLWSVRDRLTDKLEYAERDAVRARLLSLRAVVSRILGDLDLALADGREALRHAEATGELRRTSIVQARLAHVLQWRGEFEEADRLYALADSPELPDRLRAEMLELTGRSAFDQGRFVEALNHFEAALDLRKGDDREMISRIEAALDAIGVRSRERGWGPMPRSRAAVLGLPETPERWYDEHLGRWGYGDTEPAYAEAQPFQEGVAWVRRPDATAWELIGPDGDVLIGASAGFLGAIGFSDGLAWVSREPSGGWFAIDARGRVIVPGGFDEVRPFNRGVAPVRRGNWGAVDRHGRIVVQPRYRAFVTALTRGRKVAGFTDEGLAVIDAGDRLGVVDRSGQLLVAPVHARLTIHPVAFVIADRNGHWGALDRDGEPLIDLIHGNERYVVEAIDRLLADTRPVL